MRNITNKINLILIFLWVIGPFCAYFTRTFLNTSFIYLVTFLCIISFFLILALRTKINFPKYLVFFLLFLIYTIFSDKYLVNAELDYIYFYKNMILGTFLIMFIVENTYFPDNYMKIVSYVSMGIIIIAFLVLLIQQFVNINFFVCPELTGVIDKTSFEETRLPSIYSWFDDLSLLGLCFFPVLGILIARQYKIDEKYVVILFVIGAIVSFLSKSRFIMVNFLSLLFMVPLYKKISFVKVIKFVIAALIICTVSYIGLKKAGFNVDKVIADRIFEEKYGGITEGAASSRILAFHIFGKLFPKNTLWGKGRLHSTTKKQSKDTELLYELKGRSSQIHVGFLSLFYYYGIVGGGMFVLGVMYLMIDFYKTAKNSWMWGSFFGMIQYVLANTTLVALQLFIMGLILCFVYNKYYRDKPFELEINPVLYDKRINQ